MVVEMTVSEGVVGLLANAQSKSPFEGERYFFEGDLCQMSIAQSVAAALGIRTGIEGCRPYVTSKEDFEEVTKYLISHQKEGWHHYVSREEYCEIKGEYYFGGKYLGYQKEIQQKADELGISIQKGTVLFATSKEDFNAIVEKLNIAD